MFQDARPLTQDIVTDDVAANAISTVERYEIRDAWTRLAEGRVAFNTLDLFMRSALVKLDAGVRKMPVDLGHIGKLTRRVEIQTAAPWRINPWKRRIEGSAISFETELRSITNKHFELKQTLDVKAWTLPAEEAQVYRDVIAELDKSDLELVSTLQNGRFEGALAEGEEMNPFLFWAVIAAAGVVVTLLVRAFA